MEFVQPIRDVKQIETIKKLLKQQSLRDYCLFILGINSGLRISDLLKLKISDISDKGRIKDRIRLREKKTNKFKDFPLSNSTKSALKEYLKAREYNENEPLFISRKNKGFLLRQQAYKIINDVAKSVGIKEKIGTHTLRKTFGYQWYKNGGSLITLMKMYNHEEPSVTLLYVMWDNEDIEKARESIYIGGINDRSRKK